REGLDMPEVSLVAILDADKEGFLRSEGSLIQTIGRAARYVQGKAILYADVRTGSIDRAIAETDRRRSKQVEFNTAHGITPRSIVKAVADVMEGARSVQENERIDASGDFAALPPEQALKRIKKLEAEMTKLARNLEFEQAARVRDQIQKLRNSALGVPSSRAG
ncbi:MAG: excinuclease subunit, partial [Gammaproteobacteria bacterium]|nr:excinuclease subunit [Gammaproteobacteria bacterium]